MDNDDQPVGRLLTRRGCSNCWALGTLAVGCARPLARRPPARRPPATATGATATGATATTARPRRRPRPFHQPRPQLRRRPQPPTFPRRSPPPLPALSRPERKGHISWIRSSTAPTSAPIRATERRGRVRRWPWAFSSRASATCAPAARRGGRCVALRRQGVYSGVSDNNFGSTVGQGFPARLSGDRRRRRGHIHQ